MAAIDSKTGYVFHELYMWHSQGNLGSVVSHIEPSRQWETPETKRRFHNLLAVSGLLDELENIKPRHATLEELQRVHGNEYINRFKALSDDNTKGTHNVGHEAWFMPGGFEIATLSAGGTLVATEQVLEGRIRNAYALVRPPGHHAERDTGMGYCFFNNVALCAMHAIEKFGVNRVAIVDWDVHHGNGTQHAFEEDHRVLFISLHQDNNYPLKSGAVTEVGKGAGEGFTINIPLPPGSGSGAYRSAFERVVLPALDAYKPELVLVSSGFDAAYLDPLSAMMLSSEDYRYMTEALMQSADKHCEGKLVILHEGGYSEQYVPFCGLATVEQLAGIRTKVTDPFLPEVTNWGYQALQPHQAAVIDHAVSVVDLLKTKL